MNLHLRADGKPRPNIGSDSRPLWDGFRHRKLMLPFCTECGKPHLPAGPVCPFCLSEEIEWRQASGRGTVSTFVIVHKAWFPSFTKDIPYNVVQVELDEGPRLAARMVDLNGRAIAVGQKVKIGFEDVDEALTMPCFRLV